MKGEILQNINYLEGLYAYGSGENDQLYPLLENVEEGQEFYESKIPRKIPLKFLSQTETIKSIKCGQFATFILTNEGNVYSFGCADKGALGHEESYSAKIIPLKFKAIGISGGDSHGIAYNKENLAFWGQFKSKEKYIGNPYYTPTYFTKIHINGDFYKKVISGTNHVIILSEQKNVYTFGCNDFGQIGVAPRKVFHHFQINMLYENNVEDIFTGDDHSFLLKYENGQKILKAWGNNRNGQLGIGSFPKNIDDNFSIYIPTKVVFPGCPNISVKQVDGGNETSICLTDDNRVFVWGLNDFSQLGLKIKDSNIPSPREINFFNPYVNPNNKVDEIYASYEFFYAKNSLTNKIYSWGMGQNYTLGTKNESDLDSPHLINHLFFKNLYVNEISLGNAHVVVYLTEKKEMQLRTSMSQSKSKEKNKIQNSQTNSNKARKRKTDDISSHIEEKKEDFSVKVRIKEEFITLDDPDQPKSSIKKIKKNNNINKFIEEEKEKIKEIENEINSEIKFDSNDKNSKKGAKTSSYKSNKSPSIKSKNSQEKSKSKKKSYPKIEPKAKKVEKEEEPKSTLKNNKKKSYPKKGKKEYEDEYEVKKEEENSKKKNKSKSKSKQTYPKEEYNEEKRIKEKSSSKSNKKKSGQKLDSYEKSLEKKENNKNRYKSTKKVSSSLKEKGEEKSKDKQKKSSKSKNTRMNNYEDNDKESHYKEISKKNNKKSKKENKKDEEESDNDENYENNKKYSYPKKNSSPEKVESRKAKSKGSKSKEKSQKKKVKSKENYPKKKK